MWAVVQLQFCFLCHLCCVVLLMRARCEAWAMRTGGVSAASLTVEQQCNFSVSITGCVSCKLTFFADQKPHSFLFVANKKAS